MACLSCISWKVQWAVRQSFKVQQISVEEIFLCVAFILSTRKWEVLASYLCHSILYMEYSKYSRYKIFKIFIKRVRDNELFGKCSVKDVKLWHSQINSSVVRCFHVYLIHRSYSCIITVLGGFVGFFFPLCTFWSCLMYLEAKTIRVWKDLQDCRVQPLS